MFLLKKLLSQFLMPLPFATALLLLALVLLFATRRRRPPALLVAVALVVILVGGNGGVADGLLRPLESRYASFAVEPAGVPPGAGDAIGHIVVLGAGHVSDPSVPLSSRVNESAVVRLVEGIRLQRLFPGSKLVVSGGAVFDPVPSARVMAHLARELGVAGEEIIAVDEPMDTESEARCIHPIVGERPFLLVTCASHMPRAVALFERLGMRPIPAPTHHYIRRRQGSSVSYWFPRAGHLHRTEVAIHEHVGMLWAKLRGRA